MPRSAWGLAYSADGQFMVAAIRQPGGGNIPNGAGGHWWKLGNVERSGPLADETGFSLAFAPTGSLLCVAGRERAAFYASPDAAEPIASTPLTAAWAEAVAFLPDGSRAVIGAGGHLYFADPTGAAPARRVKTRFRAVMAVAPAPDGRVVLVAGKPGGVAVYAVAEDRFVADYDFGVGGVNALAVAPDGLTFSVAGERGLAVADADW